MCQSVSLLSTAVGDVTPVHSPTLQTLHHLIVLSCLRLQPSLCRSPVTTTPPSSSSLISSLLPLPCLPLLLLTGLTPWYLRPLICSLNGPTETEWISCSVTLECERESMERGRTERGSQNDVWESLLGKWGARCVQMAPCSVSDP